MTSATPPIVRKASTLREALTVLAGGVGFSFAGSVIAAHRHPGLGVACGVLGGALAMYALAGFLAWLAGE